MYFTGAKYHNKNAEPFFLDLHKNCQRDMYRCKDGSCIYDYEVCDGHSDCKGEEDEQNCSK